MVIAIIGTVFFMFFIISSCRVRYTHRTQKICFIIFALALSIMAYCALPMYDLKKHFSYMDMIERTGIAFFELISTGLGGFKHNRIYLTFNIICYLAVQIGNYHIVPFLLVLCDYLIVAYISIDWNKNHKVLYNIYLLGGLLTWMFMPFVHALSGLRNANAACLAALAIYLYLIKNKSLVIVGVIFLFAIFMHPAVALAIPFLILSKIKLTWKVVSLVIAFVFLVQRIAVMFVGSSNIFLYQIGNLYLHYSSDAQYTDSRRYLYADLLFVLLYLFISWLNWTVRKKNNSKLENFFIVYMLYVLGNVGNYDLVIRPMYVLGPLAVPLVYSIYEGGWVFKPNIKSLIKIFLTIFLSVLAIWVILDYVNILIVEYY